MNPKPMPIAGVLNILSGMFGIALGIVLFIVALAAFGPRSNAWAAMRVISFIASALTLIPGAMVLLIGIHTLGKGY